MRIIKNISRYARLCIIVIFVTACSEKSDQVILLTSQTEESVVENTTNMEELPQEDGEAKTDNQIEIVFVYICGAVNQPGVYELPGNARVFEAIEAASGYTDDAAREYLNQAALLTDGQQIRVPTVEEAEELKEQEGLTAAAVAEQELLTDNGLLNINTATVEQLLNLSGIGKAKANAIVAYREENGAFQSIEELMNIEGIKEGVFNKLKEQVTVQ